MAMCSRGSISTGSRTAENADLPPTVQGAFPLQPGHKSKSKIERQLVLARQSLSEVISDCPLNAQCRDKVVEAERLLRSVEVVLGCNRSHINRLLEADCRRTDSSPSSRPSLQMSTEVRSWVERNWTNELDGNEEDVSEVRRPSADDVGSPEESVSPRSLKRWTFISPELADLMARVQRFDCDVVAIANQPEVGNKPIAALFMYVWDKQGLKRELPQDCFSFPSVSSSAPSSGQSPAAEFQERLSHFVTATDETYRDVVYHNNHHAADVMMIMHWFFMSNYMQSQTSSFDHFTSLITAAVHDLGHDGVNNMFHVKSRSRIALRYNDKSVLENMHIATAFEMMRDHEEYDWFSLLNKAFRVDPEHKAVDLQGYFRKMMIEMVLNTDTVMHDSLMVAFKEYVANFDSEGQDSDAFTRKDSLHSLQDLAKPKMAENRQLVLKMLLHAADVSNPTRPRDIMLYFSRRVLMEFWAQGDEERARGLEVSPLCDRASGMNTVPQGQIGFISFIVKPLFTQVVMLLPEVSEAMEQLDSNVQFWKTKKEAGAKFEDIFLEDDGEDAANES